MTYMSNKLCLKQGGLFYFSRSYLTHPQIPWLNCKFKGENNKKIESGSMFFGSQHFGGKNACWSSKMGIRMSDKQIN
jgi:hypothetical protein